MQALRSAVYSFKRIIEGGEEEFDSSDSDTEVMADGTPVRPHEEPDIIYDEEKLSNTSKPLIHLQIKAAVQNEDKNAFDELVASAIMTRANKEGHIHLGTDIFESGELRYILAGERDYTYRKLVELKVSKTITELKNLGKDPIRIKLSELPSLKLENLKYVDCLDVEVSSLLCSNPGSLALCIRGGENAIKYNKVVTTKYSDRDGMFVFSMAARCLYSALPTNLNFWMSEYWLRFCPKAISEWIQYCSPVNIYGDERSKVKKKTAPLVCMSYLSGVYLKSSGPGDPLHLNGDIHFYDFQPKVWKDVTDALSRVIVPVDFTELILEVRPLYHSTWEEMLEAEELKTIIKKFSGPIEQTEQAPLFEGSKEEVALDIESNEEAFKFDLDIYLSYRKCISS